MIKNGKINLAIYVEMIGEGTIGFEGLHFYLFRMHQAFMFVDILWNLVLNEKREYEVFKYIFEVVVNQLFDEYIFVKNVFKGLEELFFNHHDQFWLVSFLCFYDHFVWKNKKFIEMYDKYGWYFSNNLIRFPTVYSFDETRSKSFNKQYIENREDIDIRKHFINNKLTYQELREITLNYFQKQTSSIVCNENEWLLFSRESILNKLEVELTQKRNRNKTVDYYDGCIKSGKNISNQEKETKDSFSEKIDIF